LDTSETARLWWFLGGPVRVVGRLKAHPCPAYWAEKQQGDRLAGGTRSRNSVRFKGFG
jgi:hypothetical protein